jgi:hypothetical protein
MTSNVTETDLLTFKSRLALNPNDIIAIRDTDDNSVSLGVNTIGDFNSYYISTSRPTFGSTFVSGLTANVLSNQLGETQTNSLTITNANVTLSEYPTSPLNIISAVATINENYTPSVNIIGATLQYETYKPFNVTSSVFSGLIGKVVENKVVRLEIIPTVSYSFTQVIGNNSNAQTVTSIPTDPITLPAVDVSLLYDLTQFDIVNGINLPVFFQSTSSPMGGGVGIYILSSRISSGKTFVPLYLTHYGHLSVRVYDENVNFPVLSYEPETPYTIFERLKPDDPTYGGDYDQTKTSYSVRLTYADGTVIESNPKNFTNGPRVTSPLQLTSYNFVDNIFRNTTDTFKGDQIWRGYDIDYTDVKNDTNAATNVYYNVFVTYDRYQEGGRYGLDSYNYYISNDYVINLSSFSTTPKTQFLSVKNVNIDLTNNVKPLASEQLGLHLDSINLDSSSNSYTAYNVNTQTNITLLSQSLLRSAFDNSTNIPLPVPFTNSTTYPIGTVIRASTTVSSDNIKNLNYTIATLTHIRDYFNASPFVDTNTPTGFRIKQLYYPPGDLYQYTARDIAYRAGPNNDIITHFRDILVTIDKLIYNSDASNFGIPFTGLIGALVSMQLYLNNFFRHLRSTYVYLNGTITIAGPDYYRIIYSQLTYYILILNNYLLILQNPSSKVVTKYTIGRGAEITENTDITFSATIDIENLNYSQSNFFALDSLRVRSEDDRMFVALMQNPVYNTFLDFFKEFVQRPGYLNQLLIEHNDYDQIYVTYTNRVRYLKDVLDGIFKGATLTYSYNYVYDIAPGIDYSSYSEDNTIYNETVVFNKRDFITHTANVIIPDPSTGTVTVTETKSLTDYLRNQINSDQTIHTTSHPIVGNVLYPGITFTYPILGGNIALEGGWQGSGNFLPSTYPLLDGTNITGFNFVNTGGAFAPILSLPQTFNITAFLNSQINDGQLSIGTIEYNLSGGIDALGISAADLQYCLPALDTLSFNIDYQVGSTFYYTHSSVTGNAGTTGLILNPNLQDTYQTIFTMADRQKYFTVSQLPAEITTLYFTTISANPTGYTFTEIPFTVKNLSSTKSYSYVIYNGISPLVSLNTGDNVSRLVDINNPYLDRKDLLFNSVSSDPGNPPINTEDETLLASVCNIAKQTDSRFNTYVNINNFIMNDQDITGRIINRFFVYKNTYLTNNINTTHSLYLFVTPLISESYVQLANEIPPALPANYPFWMPSFTQNSNGSITGIPTLDTSLLENTPFESRKFTGVSLISNYSSYPNSFSLDQTYSNYIVGNSEAALTALLGTSVSSFNPFGAIAGVPSDLIQGFYLGDYRYTSKYFTITTDINKKLYVLPFVYYKKGSSYNVYYSKSLLSYIKADVNSSTGIAANWPIGISRIPHNPSRITPVFNTSSILGYPYSYNVPGPKTVTNGQSSYCPTIDAHPGYINITIPFDGFYLDNTAYGNTSIEYYTPFGALFPSAIANVVRPITTLDPTNPSFYIRYKNVEYSALFSRGSTGYSLLLTSSTPELPPRNGKFGDVFYSGQVYSDMLIQALINSPTAPNSGRIDRISDSYHINGGFQLPRFYVPKGLELIGDATAIFKGAPEASIFGNNVGITFSVVDTNSMADGYLSFQGQRINNSNYVSGKNRFIITSNASAVNKIQPITFDFSTNTQLEKYIYIKNLKSNTTYDNFQITYYPYLSNINGTQSYYETVNLTSATFTTTASDDFSADMVTTRSLNNPREYTINVSKIGIINTGIFSGITLGGGFVLGLTFASNATTQPYISCISGSAKSFSDTGGIEIALNGNNAIAGGESGCSVSFKITNLDYGVNYTPSVHLIANDNSRSNYIPTDAIPFSIPPPVDIALTRNFNNFAGNIGLQNYNIYDTLVQTDYSLPNKLGGSVLLVNSLNFGPNIDYGSVSFTSGITYPRTLSVPINKNLVPNTSYTLYPAYSSIPYYPKGWNQYRFTDTTGRRTLSTSAGSIGINYLKTNILPSTGLTAGAISTLDSILGPNAVIYGSSVLYSYLGTTGLNSSTYGPIGSGLQDSPSMANDIDIMVNDQTVFNNLVNFLGVALEPTIYDPFNLYTDTALSGILNTFVPDGGFGFGARKQLVLQNSYPPGGTAAIGPLYIDRTGLTGSSMRYFDQNYKVLTIYTNYFPIQLHYVPPSLIPSNFTLAEYAQYTSDFTVNAGTYDGVNMIIPYYQDVLDRVAVYKENISVKRRWRMIERLDKYLQRGFTVFFQSQQQINDWNSLPSGSEIDPWWTDASSSNPKPTNTCPFRVLNQMSVLPYNVSIRTPFKPTSESLVTTSISDTPQPVLGGVVTVNGFDYLKYNAYSVASNIGGTLSVMLSSTVLGSASLQPGVYPQNVTIPLNNSVVPNGTTLMNLVFSYDDPTITGTSKVSFSYTSFDNVLPVLNVIPSFYNFTLNIENGTTIGGSNIKDTQPILKIDYYGPVLRYRGTYSPTTVYVVNDLVTQSGILYRLLNSNTGNPTYGNGWDNTSRYLKYLGVWNSSLTPALGDLVVYTGNLWKCTGTLIQGAVPGSIDMNTGIAYNWSRQLERNSVLANYSNGYNIVLPNCIPNSQYTIYLSYKNGSFSTPQAINTISTFQDKLVANVTSLGVTGYYVENVRLVGSDIALRGELITSGGSTFLCGTGVTVNGFAVGNPTISYLLNNYPSYPYTLVYNNFRFTADVGITNVSYNSVDISLNNIVSTYPILTTDSIVCITSNRNILGTIKNDGLTLSTINLTLNNLTENTYYNLSAYYAFENSNIQLGNPVSVPEFTTGSELSYVSTKLPTTTDYFATLSNFVYGGRPLTTVFPHGQTGQSIQIDVYDPTLPSNRYSSVGVVAGATASFRVSAANLQTVLPSTLTMYNLTYNFINDKGVAESYTKNELTM